MAFPGVKTVVQLADTGLSLGGDAEFLLASHFRKDIEQVKVTNLARVSKATQRVFDRLAELGVNSLQPEPLPAVVLVPRSK